MSKINNLMTDNIRQTIHGETNTRYALLLALAEKAERDTNDQFTANQTGNMAALMGVGAEKNTAQFGLN